MTGRAAALRREIAAERRSEAEHREIIAAMRERLEARIAVADAMARGPGASPLADTLPPPETSR